MFIKVKSISGQSAASSQSLHVLCPHSIGREETDEELCKVCFSEPDRGPGESKKQPA